MEMHLNYTLLEIIQLLDRIQLNKTLSLSLSLSLSLLLTATYSLQLSWSVHCIFLKALAAGDITYTKPLMNNSSDHFYKLGFIYKVYKHLTVAEIKTELGVPH